MPRTTAATQPNAMLNTTPSNQTLKDVSGAAEKRPIQPCDAGQPGDTSATARHNTNSTTSAAENPQPSATMFRRLFMAAPFVRVMMVMPVMHEQVHQQAGCKRQVKE